MKGVNIFNRGDHRLKDIYNLSFVGMSRHTAPIRRKICFSDSIRILAHAWQAW